jgi:hypothetical protein
VNDQKDCETDNVHQYKPKNGTDTSTSPVLGSCNDGDFRCTANSTDRCDHGVWFAFPCALGTKCLGCGDWECVLVDQFDSLAEKLCNGKTNLTVAEQNTIGPVSGGMKSSLHSVVEMIALVAFPYYVLA